MDPSGKMLFTCASCGYRARIPERYAGKEVHCPRCQVVQVAQAAAGGNVSGQTLTFQNLKAAFVDEKSAMKSVDKPDDTIRFTCGACNYSASLALKHAGTTIRCPGCGASQMVAAKGDPAGAPVATQSIAKAPPANEDRILFTCGDCDYKARIPARYAGRSVLCPGCGKAVPASAATAAQVANMLVSAAPAATGNTAVLTKVSTADGQPQTGAMTRVGVQFTCLNCGYQSRISPSCVGGVISCPSCRKEQKVDMGPGGGTTASAALEKKDGAGDDAMEPTITPARGNRIGSGPLPAVVLDEAEPAEPAPTPKPGSARLPTADVGSDGRTPSGRFPASVAPFTAELPPLPKTAPVATPKTDRRTAKTAPLPSVTATPPRVAQVPVAKDADADEAALLAEARALAKSTPAPQPAATPAQAAKAKTAATVRRASPTSSAVNAAAQPAAAPAAAASANERPSRPAPAAPLPPPKRRGMLAVSALLMMTVAAGVVTWQWQSTRTSLATEKSDHEATRKTLAGEKAAHARTRDELAQTKATLETTTKDRDDQKAARTKAEDELASTRKDLADTKDALAEAQKKIAAAEEQAKTLQATIDEQTGARKKAESERDDLQTRWDEAKKRLGDLLGTDAAPKAATATAAAVPAVKRD